MTDIDTKDDGREQRPRWDQEVLVRAHEVIKTIITPEFVASLGDKVPPAAELSDQHVVAFAYGIMCNDVARILGTWPPVTKSTCAWCVAAAGDTKEARDASPVYTHDEVRVHVLACTNNPLVVELAECRAAIEESKRTFIPAHLTMDMAKVAKLSAAVTAANAEVTAARAELDSVNAAIAPLADRYDLDQPDRIAIIQAMVEELANRDNEAMDAAEQLFATAEIADELGLEDETPDAIRAEIQRLRKVELEKLDEKVERDIAFDKQRIQVLADELAEHFPIAITARAYMNDEANENDLRATSDAVINASPAKRREMLPPRLREVIDGDPVHHLHETLWMVGECVRAVPRSPTVIQLVNAIKAIGNVIRNEVEVANVEE